MVLKGSKAKTVGGLTAKDLVKNKNGRTVSKKLRAKGLKNKWIQSVTAARKALGIKGFVLIGKGSKGAALLAKARSIHRK